MKRASNPGAATRKKERVDKGTRALRRSLFHIAIPSGKPQKFSIETRANLLRILNRIAPMPSSENASQMLNFAERVVNDLNIARTKEAEPSGDDEAQALRKILERARDLREAWEPVFGNPRLRNALNVLVIRGLIRNWDSNESSEEVLRKALKETISLDFFGQVGRRTAIYLDILIAAATFTVNSMDDAARIKDPSEYFFTARLAYQWSRLLRVRPT